MLNEQNNICINYGVLIRINREYQNINLKTLSDISGISVSQLSKIERGLESTSNEILSDIFESLDIDFTHLNKELEILKKLFRKFYNKVFYYEANEQIKLLVDNTNTKYQCDFQSMELKLMNLIYNLIYDVNLNKVSEIIKQINNVVDLLDNFQKQIFYDYCGVYFRKKRRIDKSIAYLNLAINSNFDKIATAMVYYHLGISYRKSHQILKSYHCMMQSRQMFLEENNFVRCCMIDFAIANLHSVNAEYDEALSLYRKCLTNYERVNMPVREISKIYVNIIWINILNDKYLEALKIIDELDLNILEYLNNTDYFKLYKIILYFYSNKIDDALALCKIIKKNYNNENIDHNFIMYFYYLIIENKAKRIKHLYKIKDLIKESSTFVEYRFLFKLLSRESLTENQLIDFNELMVNYIFNSFN